MKSNLLFRSILSFLIALVLTGSQKAYADHISSIDMFVDYIGTGPSDMKYRVTVVLYRICVGNNLALGQTSYGQLSVKSASLNYSKTLNDFNQVLRNDANGQPVYEDTLDNLCPSFSAINSCRVPANVTYSGYTTRTYSDTVTVPGRSADLTFTWQSCCRLLSYTNINGLSSAQFYVEVGINNLLKYNNSSPRYKGQPFTFACTNQPSSLSNLPSDPNGDSLVTFATPARQTATTPADVVYFANYSAAEPTGTAATGTGSYFVAPTSGKASFTASNSGRYVLAFRTEDWDRTTKQRLGHVLRDVTITVLPCTNLPPYIDSIPQAVTGVKKISTDNGEVILTACPGSPLSFLVNAHSNNPNGLIYMRPASALPGGMTATPTVTGGTGFMTINWTPTLADIGTHVVSILAVDSTCAVGQEITLRNEFTFTIDVRSALDAGRDLLVCPLGERPVQLSVNANPASSVAWTNLSGAAAEFLSCTDCHRPVASPPYSYTYVVTTDDPFLVCKTSDTVVVAIDTSVKVEALQDPLLVCRPSYIQLLAQASGPGPHANIPCGTANPITCAVPDEDTAFVGTGLNPSEIPANTPFYTGKAFAKYQFIIPKSEILASGFYSGTINGMAFRTIYPTINGTNPMDYFYISLACVPFTEFPKPINNNSFFPNYTQVALKTGYALTANDWNQIDFDQPYSWDTSMNILVDICVGPQTINANGIDPVAVVPGAAIMKSDNGINVCGGNVNAVSSFGDRPVVRFNFCPTPVLPFLYHWAPGNNLSDSNVKDPLAYIPRSVNYAVYTVGRNGCIVRDSLHITIPTHTLSAGPTDTIACVNQFVTLHASGGDGYKWYEVHNGVFSDASGSLTCTDCAEPIATPPVTTTYAVVFTNNVHQTNPINPNYETGCPDTLTLTVFVNPLPNVRVESRDTMIKYGQTVQLYASGAQWYSWSPAGSLSDPNSPSPVASPRESIKYVVYGRDMNGCVNTDSVHVYVDYRDNILVPTGFTPNGDGKNDVFKPVTFTVHRLLEFRVFNRWGQEVFSTTDKNAGWDGTWKGVEQGIGNYSYLIRVAYPDNYTETFKGEVTLIR